MAQRDLYQHDAQPIRLVEGVAANAPGTSTASLFVIIPTFDPVKRWGPCPWTPHGTILPAVGARCLLAFPENGPNPWIVAWVGGWA